MAIESEMLAAAGALFAAFALLGPLSRAFPLRAWLRVARRWARFAFFSLALALAAKKYAFPDAGFAELAAAGALSYALVETLIYWLQICAASSSGLPPFGTRKKAESAWSCEPSMIRLKRKIEALGFKKSGAFIVEFGGGMSAKTTIFDSADGKTRLDVTFVPIGNSYIVSSSASSVDSDGARWATDGNPTPFGLSFPSGWKVARKPLACDPLKLLKIHAARLEKSGKTFVPISETPDEYAAETAGGMERQSARDGLMNAGSAAEESGIFTQEGKTRIWLDMIMTNYFPFLR